MGEIIEKAAAGATEIPTVHDLELAVKVSDRIELKQVRLVGCHCVLKRPPSRGQKSFDIERIAKAEMAKDTNTVLVLATFTLKMYDSGSDTREPFAEIQAAFSLAYKADALDDLSKEHVDCFANTNGFYNAWPYWREFAQNMTARLNLPPLTLPVFRIFPPRQPQGPKDKPQEDSIAVPPENDDGKPKAAEGC